jgi:hypothetical protein
MPRRNAALSHRLGFESLEGRLMMAGNVNVSVSGGDLVVTGDSAGNVLGITQVVQNGALVAGKFSVEGSDGTTINGQTGAQTFQNVTDDFRINLNGGPDSLRLGAGLTFGRFVIPDDLEINSGTGNDTILLDGISVGDDATIITGSGDDTVGVRAEIGRDGIGGGINDLLIDTGANVDSVQVFLTPVRHNLIINTGADNFGDKVDIAFAQIGNSAFINTGAGNDTVETFRVSFTNDLTVNTGSGQDDVHLIESTVDELFASLGTDADTLELTTVTGRRATLIGGSGNNSLVQSGNSFSQSFQTFNF